MKSDKTLSEHYTLVIQTGDNFYCCNPKGDTATFSRTEDMYAWAKGSPVPLLWLRQSDMLALSVTLPANADDTEASQAILFEAASLSNRLPEDCATSYIRRDTLPGGNREELAAIFDLQELQETQETCRKSKIKFGGFATLQQLLLLHHFTEQLSKNAILLYFGEDSAFLAQLNGQDISIRNLSFGIHGSVNSAQWAQRAQRRLAMLEGQTVVLYVERKNEAFYQLINDLFKPEKLMMQSFEEIMPLLGQFAYHLLHPALPPPKKEDPRAPVTRLAILAVLVFSLYTGVETWQLQQRIGGLETTNKEQQEIKNRLSSAAAQVKRDEEQLAKLKSDREMLRNVEHFNREFLVPFNLLSRYSLRYTRITEITQNGMELIVAGETVRQSDLMKFERHFTKQLTNYGFKFTSDGLKKPDNKKAELTFRYTIKGGR